MQAHEIFHRSTPGTQRDGPWLGLSGGPRLEAARTAHARPPCTPRSRSGSGSGARRSGCTPGAAFPGGPTSTAWCRTAPTRVGFAPRPSRRRRGRSCARGPRGPRSTAVAARGRAR
eukprot:scaffold1674_cov340-Prasinococcus_capsulatus_cf.AAC.6